MGYLPNKYHLFIFSNDMSHVVELNGQNFTQEVLESTVPVLVDFWAPWCGPCRMMAPVLEEVAEAYKGSLKVAKLNVDDSANQELAMQFRIQGIPNMQIFKAGKVVKELVGFRQREVLFGELKQIV